MKDYLDLLIALSLFSLQVFLCLWEVILSLKAQGTFTIAANWAVQIQMDEFYSFEIKKKNQCVCKAAEIDMTADQQSMALSSLSQFVSCSAAFK